MQFLREIPLAIYYLLKSGLSELSVPIVIGDTEDLTNLKLRALKLLEI